MLRVTHHAGSYPIEMSSLDSSMEKLPPFAFVVTDTNVKHYYGDLLTRVPHFAMEAGEGSKCLDVYRQVVAWLASAGANRRATVVALGGGVVGDLAGFVAATYMRGVRFIQIPTSLLAMVDSSVGSKVGVDLPEGKNLLGAFKGPEAVFIPLETLRTLPEREFASGMAEICKIGFIAHPALHALLAKTRLSHDAPVLPGVVKQCIAHKAYVVQNDEFETTGLRATLNYGHTIGHAIEQATGYGPVLHGEAISVGMRVEAELAVRLGLASDDLPGEVSASLTAQGLPTRLGLDLNPDVLVAAMRRDKKSTGEGLAFSLVTEIGQCKLITTVAESDVTPLLGNL